MRQSTQLHTLLSIPKVVFLSVTAHRRHAFKANRRASLIELVVRACSNIPFRCFANGTVVDVEASRGSTNEKTTSYASTSPLILAEIEL